MAVALPNLVRDAWFSTPAVKVIFAVLGRDSDEARIVGGAVRDALLHLPIGDIDFATTATPRVVMDRAETAGIRAVPTGIDHGTVTLVVDGKGYEVTTLREDIETDGRHAVVRFGRDWEADARRRDFTINALSVDRDGHIHDPVGGYHDVLDGRIRFIGEPGHRIAEDRLRILRFFRFYAQYGRGDIDRAGLSAAIRRRDELCQLSPERIGQEMRRLVLARGAAETASLMQESGILGIVLGGVGYLGTFRRLIAFETCLGIAPAAAIRLAALGCRVEEDVERLAQRLRLANAERDRMQSAVVAARARWRSLEVRGARRRLYRLGAENYRDAVALAFAWDDAPPDEAAWADLYRLPARWQIPRFPMAGRDLLQAGAASGPGIGALLGALESWWIEQDFAPDKAALDARLQQLMAAAQ